MRLTVIFENHAGYRKGLLGYHGFSVLVEHSGRKVLVDTGTDGSVLLHNMDSLGISPGEVDAIFLTHGHYDHTGGLKAFLQERGKGVDVYAHPDIFQRRIALEPKPREIGIPFTREELEDLGARFHLTPKPMEFLPGFLSSGEVERRHWDRAVGYLTKNGEYVKDPVRDDVALIVDLGGEVAVITGCGHSGILNIAEQAIRLTGKPIGALIGGFHLRGAKRKLLDGAIGRLKSLKVGGLYAGHCTGVDEYAYLKARFQKTGPLHVGLSLEL